MKDFTIKDSPGKGKGIFTEKAFEKNQVIFRFEGTLVTTKESKTFSLPDQERLLQIGQDLFLDVKKHFSVFTNHSCNPNCLVKIAVKDAFLLAARPIKAGEELYFDYSTTSTENADSWSMKCACDPFNCRKIISGFGSVPEKIQNKMISLGMVPNYVIKSR